MTFLAPWAAWFLAGVPVIVLLYLLKLKRRPVTVSTLLFWAKVMQENRQRALFQKLRNLFSLLLHLLIFLLIVAALAKPAFDRLVREGASIVLIVDTRARMQAVESDQQTRFARALAEARRYIREAGAGRQLALLTAGASPQVIVPFTSDERALLKGLDSITVTDATGDLDASIALANSLLASRQGDKSTVVLSDGSQLSTLNSQPPPNVAITRFATRPLLASPQTSEVLLVIKNFGRAAMSGNVEISFDGKLLDVKPFTLEPGGERFDVFPSVPRASRHARGWLTAKLDVQDALAVDNLAYAVLPPPPARRVLLVTKGNWFVEKLLAADQQTQFELIEPSAWQPAFATKFDAVILDNFLPPDFDLSKSGGNFLFLKSSPFTTGDAPLATPLISENDATHPVLRLVNLQNVTILRAAPLQAPSPADGWTWQMPLRSFDHALLLTGSRRVARGEQRVAALAFDIGDSDLPLRIAFPLLMTNATRWLAGDARETITAAVAGEPIPLPRDAMISTEAFTSLTAQPDLARTTAGFFQPLHNGFYLLTENESANWVAVNTFSDAESNLRGADENASAQTSPPLPIAALSTFTGWPLWQYLALVALALFTLEWWLFHRRRTE